MKNYRFYMAVLACAALALSGCTKFEWTSGTAIRFGAGSQAGSLTKTSYGAIVDGTPRKQMVDWAAGDVIRIACAQASTEETGTSTSADYKTTSAGSRYNSTAESRARLELNDNNDKGLRWGSTSSAHVFYAVYPSPYVKSGTSLSDDGKFTGIIPEKQTATFNSTAPHNAIPDMTNQYMLAKRTVAAGDQEIDENEVFLNFTPMTTAIEFEVTNKMSAAIAIQNIEIISAASNLSGTFSNTTLSADLNENGIYTSTDPYPAFTAATGAKKTAAVDFGTSGHTLAVDDKLTFTIFLLPESKLNDLTFKINKVGGGYIKTNLKTDASTWISFDRCKRHFIKGLFVNEGASWTLFLPSEIENWGDNSSDMDLKDPPSAGSPTLDPWGTGEDGDLPLKES